MSEPWCEICGKPLMLMEMIEDTIDLVTVRAGQWCATCEAWRTGQGKVMK